MAFCLCFLIGCSGNPGDRHIEDPTQSESYSIGYDEGHATGYDEGYEEGIKYVLSALREGANDWEIYMEIEDIDDSIHDYIEAYQPNVDCCDVRDLIIYSGYEHYTLNELLERLIDENIDEPTS